MGVIRGALDEDLGRTKILMEARNEDGANTTHPEDCVENFKGPDGVNSGHGANSLMFALPKKVASDRHKHDHHRSRRPTNNGEPRLTITPGEGS